MLLKDDGCAFPYILSRGGAWSSDNLDASQVVDKKKRGAKLMSFAPLLLTTRSLGLELEA
jgi:hypothetical protein